MKEDGMTSENAKAPVSRATRIPAERMYPCVEFINHEKSPSLKKYSSRNPKRKVVAIATCTNLSSFGSTFTLNSSAAAGAKLLRLGPITNAVSNPPPSHAIADSTWP